MARPLTVMRARKRFGQHFLTDEAVLLDIASAIAIKPEHRVLEIGPGHGALTAALLGRTPTGAAPAQYIGVEIDRDLIAGLRSQYPLMQLVHADVLELDFAALFARADRGAVWRVVGNLPYNVSTPLLNKLFATPRVADMHFMLQLEVAMRLAAQPGSKAWGRLSVNAQYHCDIEVLFVVEPESFQPPPAVRSAVVRFLPRSEKLLVDEPAQFDAVVRSAFNQRRKRLANALKLIDIDWQGVSVDPNLRADEVSLQDFVDIANAAGSNTASSKER